MQPKNFLKSKVVWVNALSAVGAIGMSCTDAVPAQYQPLLLAVLAIANIVLRFLTSQPIAVTKSPTG